MYPFIQGGKDEVEIVPLDSHPSFPLWSCVFYQWNGHYMIHRYIGRNGNKYRMMGDGDLPLHAMFDALRDAGYDGYMSFEWVTKWARDIAVGEAQPLGMPLSYGGPYLGFMATTNKHMRKLPGRIIGETVDSKGDRAYCLALQAREQHIRREKASSNICSNEALCALIVGVYCSAVGPDGLASVATQSMSKAHYLAKELCKIPGISMKYTGEFFHEFVVEMPKVDEVLKALEEAGILGGLPVEGGVLWCATEKASKAVLDKTVAIVKEVCAK